MPLITQLQNKRAKTGRTAKRNKLMHIYSQILQYPSHNNFMEQIGRKSGRI